MCLLFISYRKTPGFKLVLAANRDEFLARPTAALGFLDRDRTILCGRDLQEGGTWLAIDAGSRFAAVTNYRKPLLEIPFPRTRGDIVINYVTGSASSREYVHFLQTEGNKYNGFNVIVGDSDSIYYYSNQGPAPKLLQPGFYGLSNHLLDTQWPKVSRGKKLLYRAIVETANISHKRVFDILADSELPADHELPDTGVGLEWERLLSSVFIDSEIYGTRSSALITVDDAGEIDFYEKTYLRNKVGPRTCLKHESFAGRKSS
jgi:uncharacterized protein with NRDE domain